MDDAQRIVKCGNLSLHTPGGFFKKRWHSKYLVLYDGSKSGVKRLELFDSEIKFKKQNPARIIPLVDCVRVVTCQRNKTTYTFEVRTSDQFYLLAAQSFTDMTDWVNCLRLVAFGQSSSSSNSNSSSNATHPTATTSTTTGQQEPKTRPISSMQTPKGAQGGVDVLLESAKKRPQKQQEAAMSRTADYVRSLDELTTTTKKSSLSSPSSVVASAIGGGGKLSSSSPAPQVTAETHPSLLQGSKLTTASQAAAAAASALAKTRQRQPSLLGSCKPQPPMDSPFICQPPKQQQQQPSGSTTQAALIAIGQLDTMTPTMRGQLISSAIVSSSLAASSSSPPPPSEPPAAPPTAAMATKQQVTLPTPSQHHLQQKQTKQQLVIQATLDEEEENMLYCSIEDNPSEHNYRVKVIETELSLRCQLKCYQLTAPITVCQQYEQLSQFSKASGERTTAGQQQQLPVTFYQLIIGPQELTLLNDYATARQQQQQQGLWSWPYQCIRRYGFDKDNCFMFEAGRKCSSGPGQFIVQTPKAYQIYQDVVKFVNELRSLSSSSVLDTATASNGSNTSQTSDEISKHQEKQMGVKVSVTQIPVSWTPSVATSASAAAKTTASNIGINIDPAVNRQQFFDTLRQLDASAAAAAASGAATNQASNSLSKATEAKSVSPPATSRQQEQLPLPPSQHQHRQVPSRLPKSHQAKSQPDLVAHTKSSAAAATINSQQTPIDFSSTSPQMHASISSGHLHSHQQQLLLQRGQEVAPIAVAPASRVSPPPQVPSQPQAPASQTEHNHSSAKVQQQPSLPPSTMGSGKKCSSIAASDETDESGYDQGDDSVDSSAPSSTIVNCQRQQQKLPSTNATNGSGAGNSRKRPSASDCSMSSASSTSSGGGSPGHSAGRRSAESVLSNPNLACLLKAQGQIASNKRTPLPAAGNGSAKDRPLEPAAGGAQRPAHQSGNKLASGGNGSSRGGLRSILTVSQAGDFEANLIRDVYSEITKLHAKFAVTSGSAEDSMSNSSSSNEGSASSENCSSSGSGGLMIEHDVDSGGGGPHHREPMYASVFKKQQQRLPNRGDQRVGKNCELNNPSRRLRRDPFHEDRDKDYEDDDELELAEGRRNLPSSRGLNKCSQPTTRHSISNRIQQQQQPHNYHDPRQFVHPMMSAVEPHDNSYKSQASAYYDNGYLSCLQQPQSSCGTGLYPSILNPIPECGELERPPPRRPFGKLAGQHANPTAKPKPTTPTSNNVCRV